MKMDTKWKLITSAVHIACLTVGIAIVFFALSAVLVTWKYAGHEFFWWTIPHAVIGSIISGVGFAVAILPFILKHIDMKTSYKK